MLFHEWKLTYKDIKELKFTLHSWHAYLACIPVGIVDAGIVALVQPLWHCVCACTWVCEGERGENGTFSVSGFNVQCIDSTQTNVKCLYWDFHSKFWIGQWETCRQSIQITSLSLNQVPYVAPPPPYTGTQCVYVCVCVCVSDYLPSYVIYEVIAHHHHQSLYVCDHSPTQTNQLWSNHKFKLPFNGFQKL